MKFVVDVERRLVIARFPKVLTGAEIQSYVTALCSHPGFDPSFSEIADISAVTKLPLDASEFLQLADDIDPFLATSKRAFVVRTPVQMHAARIHKMLRNQRNFEIFPTLAEAEHWISDLERRNHPLENRSGADQTVRECG